MARRPSTIINPNTIAMEQQNQQPQPPVFNQPQQPAPQYQPRVTASPMMDPFTAIKTCFKKYFDFKGRARRSEFWWFVLFVNVVSWCLSFAGMVLPAVGYVSMAFALAIMIPQFAVLCRRLHDTNHGSWWAVLLAIMVVGYLVSLFMMIGSNLETFANTANPQDVMDMAKNMADAVQSSPVQATIMMGCSLGASLLTIVLLIFCVLDSKWGENKYGPSPKYK